MCIRDSSQETPTKDCCAGKDKKECKMEDKMAKNSDMKDHKDCNMDGKMAKNCDMKDHKDCKMDKKDCKMDKATEKKAAKKAA